MVKKFRLGIVLFCFLSLHSPMNAQKLEKVNMQDFTRDVYRGAICRHAAVLLGQKELNNQRNQKDRRQSKLYNMLVPADLVHKYGDIDIGLFQKGQKK